MKKLRGNIGRVDRNIRIGLVVILLMLYNQFQSGIFLVAAVIIAVTVVMSWCPVYFLTGYKTRSESKNIN